MTDAIRWDLADTGVLTLSFDRPEVKNAIDTAGQQLLVKRLGDAARHPGVKVVVLTGTGSSFWAFAGLHHSTSIPSAIASGRM